MKSVLLFFRDPHARLRMLARRGLLKWMSDEQFLKRMYRTYFGKSLDLKNPRTFNEKLQWLKLYDRKPLYTQMVDKYAVRRYIEEQIGGEYLIPLVGGPWNSFDEIDFDALPEQFVLKCTHDSGGLVICRDKHRLDREAARRKIERSLRRNYYVSSREWPYKDVKPRIIAEAYMEDASTSELRDYKFFCFGGEPKMLFVASDRQTAGEETKFDFFDMDYNHLDLRNGHPNAAVPPEKPAQFGLMRELAQKLSQGIPHVRVDLYEVNGRVYFGEMTFYHWSGMVPFDPPEWDERLGSWITLPASADGGKG